MAFHPKSIYLDNVTSDIQTQINNLSGSNSGVSNITVATISAGLLSQTYAASANALAQATSLININTALDANQASQISSISATNISQQTTINELGLKLQNFDLCFKVVFDDHWKQKLNELILDK